MGRQRGDNPPYHTPVFVLTNHPPASITMEGGTTFHFVSDGIDAAFQRAIVSQNLAQSPLGSTATSRRLMAALGPGCVKTRTFFFKVELWPRLGGNSSQEIFRHHREGTTKEKDSQQVSRRSVFTQPGSFTSLRRCPPVGCFTPLNEHDLRQLSRPTPPERRRDYCSRLQYHD